MFLAEQPGRIHSPDLQVTSVLDQPRAYDGVSPHLDAAAART
ncbi:hypothetical protein ACTWPT_41280 [Nonomuraea sp. 3N208]